MPQGRVTVGLPTPYCSIFTQSSGGVCTGRISGAIWRIFMAEGAMVVSLVPDNHVHLLLQPAAIAELGRL